MWTVKVVFKTVWTPGFQWVSLQIKLVRKESNWVDFLQNELYEGNFMFYVLEVHFFL